jgi:hypothetical protein
MDQDTPKRRRILAQFADWPRVRWFIAGCIALALAAGLGSSTGLLAEQSTVPGGFDEVIFWWVYPTIILGAIGAGVLIASYSRAPSGAGATFCDLRWPLFALLGIALATGSRATGETFAALLAGPSGSLAEVARMCLGAASLLLIAWALRDRLALEQAARDAADSGEVYPVCTDCRPLFR